MYYYATWEKILWGCIAIAAVLVITFGLMDVITPIYVLIGVLIALLVGVIAILLNINKTIKTRK